MSLGSENPRETEMSEKEREFAGGSDRYIPLSPTAHRACCISGTPTSPANSSLIRCYYALDGIGVPQIPLRFSDRLYFWGDRRYCCVTITLLAKFKSFKSGRPRGHLGITSEILKARQF